MSHDEPRFFNKLKTGEEQIMQGQMSDFNFTVNPEVASSVHDNGIVLLHVASGHLYTSNSTGARIWRGLEEHLSPETIADEINDEYQIGRTMAQEHVQCFIAELQQRRLIEWESNR
jgi:hypothetical protein